ncbi:MAG: hypothetical protein ACTSP9_03080 [Promethearchaeota archaeon]
MERQEDEERISVVFCDSCGGCGLYKNNIQHFKGCTNIVKSRSDMSDKTRTLAGSGLLQTLVFVLFLGLKLGGVIDWSWWWVTSPLWLPITIFIAFIILIIIVMIFAMAIKTVVEK